MNRLEAVWFPSGLVYHLAPESDPAKVLRFPTLCGRSTKDIPRAAFVRSGEVGGKRMCAVCVKGRQLAQFPEYPDAKVVTRAEAIDPSKITPAVEAKVYRITGGTDIYTVVIGPQISICSCMAGKTHPETMCKHQVAVWTKEDTDE